MPKPSIAQTLLVMMRTFSARLRVLGRSSIGGRSRTRARVCEELGAAHRSLAAEAGDTLIEVLVSALLLGLIVVGTFSGLNSTNRATSLDRARSQADALAEQNEEQLRAEPIKKLYELESHPRTENVTEGKTTYTIETTARYIEDATATASCTSSSAKEANYLQTTSKVTSPLIGAGKSVEETSIISPPAGSSLVVQVTEAGAPIQGAEVVATGPAPATTTHELETSVNGCAILALPPGEYNIDASKSGYVDPNGYKHTNEDSSGSVTHSVYIPAENTSKVGYNLGLAGTLEVKFEAKLTEGSAATPTEGDSFVAFNTGMTKPRPFPIPFTPGIYSTTVTSPATIFPFKSSKYTIYAGTCEADLPSTNGVPLVEAEEAGSRAGQHDENQGAAGASQHQSVGRLQQLQQGQRNRRRRRLYERHRLQRQANIHDQLEHSGRRDATPGPAIRQIHDVRRQQHQPLGRHIRKQQHQRPDHRRRAHATQQWWL